MAMQPRPPGYQSEMPGNTLRVLIPLLVPIRHGSELLTEVELTEPDLGAMMKLDEATGEMGQTLYTICACTNLPPSVIKQLKLRDVKVIGEAASKLLGEASPGTGEMQPLGSLTIFPGNQAS
jgi:hypothetical protein